MADAAPAADDRAFRRHEAGLRGNRPDERNLELERRLRNALVQHGPDSEPHAAVEQRRSKASVNRAGRIEVTFMRFRRDNNAALGNLDNVIAEGLRHRVQGQRAVDKALHKFEAAHGPLPLAVDHAKAFQAPRPRRRAKRPTLTREYPRSPPISRRGKSRAADQRTPTGRRIRRAPWCRLFLLRADVALELAMKIVGADVFQLLRQIDRRDRLIGPGNRAAVAERA